MQWREGRRPRRRVRKCWEDPTIFEILEDSQDLLQLGIYAVYLNLDAMQILLDLVGPASRPRPIHADPLLSLKLSGAAK